MEISELKNYNVLYVEDSTTIRNQMVDVLEELFYKVFVAKDGKEGMEIFMESNQNIDLVITDIQMPNLNGIELSRRIKDTNEEVPIVVTTAFDDRSYLIDAISIGVDKYVLKPIKFNILIDNILQALTKSYHQKSLVKRNAEITALMTLLDDIIFDDDFDLEGLKKRFRPMKKHITIHDIEMF